LNDPVSARKTRVRGWVALGLWIGETQAVNSSRCSAGERRQGLPTEPTPVFTVWRKSRSSVGTPPHQDRGCIFLLGQFAARASDRIQAAISQRCHDENTANATNSSIRLKP